MSVNIRKFELGKEVPIERVRQFYEAARLDRTQVLDVSVIQKTPNAAVYLLTYEDVMAPYVVGTSPANGATGIPTNSNIIIQFSEAVQNIVPADVEVLKNGVPVVLGAGDITTAGAVVTISSAVDATPNANYVVTLKTTIKDVVGNTMEYPYVFSFTTATQLAGLAFKADHITPDAADVAAGYVDISFTSAFTNSNYDLAEPSFHWGAPVSGVVFRVTNKTAGGFRLNFDFLFPLGASLEWMAIYGAPS